VVQVVDTEQLTVIDRFSVGAVATAMAVSTSESRLYLTTADGVLSIDLPSKSVTARTPLPGTAMDAAVSPNGDELYVALGGARLGIAVLRSEDLAVVHVIGLDAAPERLVVATI
jgi:DNA-binding beta-propeller fold protein YncE